MHHSEWKTTYNTHVFHLNNSTEIKTYSDLHRWQWHAERLVLWLHKGGGQLELPCLISVLQGRVDHSKHSKALHHLVVQAGEAHTAGNRVIVAGVVSNHCLSKGLVLTDGLVVKDQVWGHSNVGTGPQREVGQEETRWEGAAQVNVAHLTTFHNTHLCLCYLGCKENKNSNENEQYIWLFKPTTLQGLWRLYHVNRRADYHEQWKLNDPT